MSPEYIISKLTRYAQGISGCGMIQHSDGDFVDIDELKQFLSQCTCENCKRWDKVDLSKKLRACTHVEAKQTVSDDSFHDFGCRYWEEK